MFLLGDVYKRQALKQLIKKIKKTEYANDPTVLWAEEKLAKYEQLQSHPNAVSYTHLILLFIMNNN